MGSMDPKWIRALLEGVRAGETDVDSAFARLKELPYADLGFARVDHHRALRQGVPEVVLGEGKTPEQIVQIAERLSDAGQNVLVTRLQADAAAAVLRALPKLQYNATARIATWVGTPPEPLSEEPVPVLTAGTSDIPVAEEAAETLALCGVTPRRIFDVGVAGIHRLVGHVEELNKAPVLIVVAGMEGALASVVGGLVAGSVVAVPTSVGYGVSLNGMTALFGMLSSCAAGVTVVNIDNGFGAAMAVVRQLRAGALRSGAGR